MHYPNFFDNIKPITIYDPLAHTLGVGDGMFIFHYLDAVKLAGHSCPTVAGAWLCTQKALHELYGDDIPHRGMLDIAFSSSVDEGVTGVIASIITLITGASAVGGFKGMEGKFSRNNKLSFSQNIKSQMKFTRIDTQKSIELIYDPISIEIKPEQQKLMQKVLKEDVTSNELEKFGQLWQDRVERIFEHSEKLIKVL